MAEVDFMMSRLQRSFWMMAIAAFFGAMIAVSIKALSFHVSIAVIFFFTRVFLLVGAIPTILRYRFDLFRTKRIGVMMVMAALYVAGFYCYFYSLVMVPLSLSSLLMNSSPLYVPFLAYFILKSKAFESKMLWISMLISFIGVILILLPSGSAHYSLLGLLLAFLSGILLGASQVVMKLATEEVNASRIAFFQSIFSIVITFFPAMIIISRASPNYLHGFWTLENTAMLVLAGVSSWIYQLYRAKAFECAPVSFAMPFAYLGVVFVGILDAIFWGIIPDWLSILGMLIVVSGVIVLLKRGQYDINP